MICWRASDLEVNDEFSNRVLSSSAADLELFRWVAVAGDGNLMCLIAEPNSFRALLDSVLSFLHVGWIFSLNSESSCLNL